MDELRESSLLFSLESLLETERERVQREGREAERRREEELRRVAELGERRRKAAESERVAKARREALEAERERLDHERFEAIKQATVERARIETEGQLRLLEAEQARQHDLALARLREGQRTGYYRTLSWLGTSGLALVTGAALLGYFGWLKPLQARESAQQRSLLGVAQANARESQALLAVERRETQALRARVDELTSKLAKAASLNAPGAASAPGAPSPPHGSAPSTPHGSSATSGKLPAQRGPCPDDGDPLRSCLR